MRGKTPSHFLLLTNSNKPIMITHLLYIFLIQNLQVISEQIITASMYTIF